MHSFLDAKTMAKILRGVLSERGVIVSTSESLEIVSKQFGFQNWNVLAARIVLAKPDTPELEHPDGWRRPSSTDLSLYRCGLDPNTPGTALIESRFAQESGVVMAGQRGGLLQSLSAKKYLGKRIEFSADLRSENADAGTIWVELRDAAGRTLLGINLAEAGGFLTGTIDWTKRSIVVAVDEDVDVISFGFSLLGAGRPWARSMQLEIVDQEVPLTVAWSKWRDEPANLNLAPRQKRSSQARA